MLIAAPAVAAAASSSAGKAAWRHIPANAFQMVPPGGQPYMLVDRGAFLLCVCFWFGLGVV